MDAQLLSDALEKAGLSNAFSVIELDALFQELERVDVQAALANESIYRFFQGIVQPRTLPATWQKLADLGWSDEEVSGLVDGNLLQEAPQTLVSVINAGALSLDEYNEFANYPNQEVRVFYYTPNAQQLISWLQGNVVLPKISQDAYYDEE